MTESKFVVDWDAGFENMPHNDFNEVKQVRKRHEARHNVEKPFKKTMERNSGIERLYRLAGCFIEDMSPQR